MKLMIDMDGVLADFEGEFARRWNNRYGQRLLITPETRTRFKLVDEFPDHADEIKRLQTQPGFFAGLPPIEGAIEGMRRLEADGHDVWILTAPLSEWRNCVHEKYDWVDAHLGAGWTNRIIMAKPKWLVDGDRLLDDKPAPAGDRSSSWEHVVFDAPYNQRSRARQRMASWADLSALTGDWFESLDWRTTSAGDMWDVDDLSHSSVAVKRSSGAGVSPTPQYSIEAWCEMYDQSVTFSAAVYEHEVREAANHPSQAEAILMGRRREWRILPAGGPDQLSEIILSPYQGYERGGRGW